MITGYILLLVISMCIKYFVVYCNALMMYVLRFKSLNVTSSPSMQAVQQAVHVYLGGGGLGGGGLGGGGLGGGGGGGDGDGGGVSGGLGGSIGGGVSGGEASNSVRCTLCSAAVDPDNWMCPSPPS